MLLLAHPNLVQPMSSTADADDDDDDDDFVETIKPLVLTTKFKIYNQSERAFLVGPSLVSAV